MLPWLQHLFLAGLLGAATYWDCRTGKIPNPLSLAGALAGLTMVLLHLQFRRDPGGLMLGGIVAGGALLFLYLGGGVGGGDVKLGIGFGLLSGYPETVRYLFFGGLAALIIILGRLAWRGELFASLREALGRRTGFLSPGDAAREAQRPQRAGASTSLPLALLIGVVWVWGMRLVG